VPLFPLRILWTDPGGLGTADAAGVCRCDDGCDYALKDGTKHPRTPHNEWFCSQLAALIGVAGPAFAAVEQTDGTVVFGSRWEGGVAKEQWHQMAVSGTISFDDVKVTLAKIFAFDNFVYNDDRHIGNYVVRSQRTGHALLALDYSRAWFYHGFPLSPLPFNAAQNTIAASRWVTGKFGQYINGDTTKETLDWLEAVTKDDVSGIINGYPKSWITASEKDDVVHWWASQARKDRINGIRHGIKDGTYL
jgi:hypothetical protein